MVKIQRLVEQVRLILNKGWFSYLEILEICEPVIREENAQEAETQNIENQNTTKSMLT